MFICTDSSSDESKSSLTIAFEIAYNYFHAKIYKTLNTKRFHSKPIIEHNYNLSATNIKKLATVWHCRLFLRHTYVVQPNSSQSSVRIDRRRFFRAGISKDPALGSRGRWRTAPWTWPLLGSTPGPASCSPACGRCSLSSPAPPPS